MSLPPSTTRPTPPIEVAPSAVPGKVRQPARCMERKHRLTRSIDFKRVRRKGTSHAHPLAVLISSRNELAVTRVGVSAAKSIGNAVRRNRTKRRLREALRRQLSRIESGWDVVVIARPDAVVADWDLLCSAVDGLLKQSGLLREPNRDEHEA